MQDRILNIEGKNIQLQATDEGFIQLKLFNQYHKVVHNDLQHIIDMSFIMAQAGEGSRTNLFLPVKLSLQPDVYNYFKYWDGEKLKELKSARVKSFIAYIEYCLDFIKNNVDIETYKPTYSTEYNDNTDYGGGISTYVYVYLKCGKDWDDNFRITSQLNEFLSSQLIDRHFSGEDDYYWFSNIIVQFRPLDDNKEDFFPKTNFKALEKWEEGCLVPVTQLIASLRSGMGTEGSGVYSDGLCKTNIPFTLSDIDNRFNYVVWYDK